MLKDNRLSVLKAKTGFKMAEPVTELFDFSIKHTLISVFFPHGDDSSNSVIAHHVVKVGNPQ